VGSDGGYTKVSNLYMIEFFNFCTSSAADGSETDHAICTLYYLKMRFVLRLHISSGMGGARRSGQVGAQHLQAMGELGARLRCTLVGWNAGLPVRASCQCRYANSIPIK